MWKTIVNWLDQVPATFWGVLAGSLFTLLGVWLQNRWHDRRLDAQLAHDRELKARERDLALRKEIYLAAAETVQAAFNALANCPNLDVPNDKVMSAYVEKNMAIAKMYVVAKPETAKAIANLLSEFTDASMRLMLERLPVFGRKVYADSLQGYIDGWEKEAARWLEEIKQFNLSGSNDQRRWSVLSGNLEIAQKNARDLRRDEGAARKEQYRGALALYENAITETSRLQALVKPLVLSVRRELATTDDEETFGAVLDEVANQAADRARKYTADLRRLLPGEDNAPPRTQLNGRA